MLLDFRTIVPKFDLRVTGVIHVGAHLAEEALIYNELGINKVVWIEANPAVLVKICSVIDPLKQELVHALITDTVGETYQFNVTNYDGMSSSIYNWGTHTQFSPDTVVESTIELTSTTLDHLFFETDHRCLIGPEVNLLNIDIEGAGLLALYGAPKLLEQIDYLYLEVQTDNVYDGAPLLDEIQEFLTEFTLVELGMVEGQGWGDALFTRKSY